MSNTKLRFSGTSGFTAGALLWSNTSDLVWNGTAMVSAVSAPTVYATSVPVPEVFSGSYSTAVPVNLPPDLYRAVYYDLTSGDVIFQADIQWDGSQIVDDLVTASNQVDICNKALAHLGVARQIANLTTDTTTEAAACRTFFDTALNQVLGDFSWAFATRMSDLALVTDNPTTEWAHAYRYPTNCLFVRRIIGTLRTDSKASRVPYKIIGDDAGQLIYTDMDSAQIEYLAKVTNPTRYTPDFILALSYRIAALIAPMVTAGDPYKLGDKAMVNYLAEIKQAEARDGNEQSPDPQPDSEFIEERN